MSGTKKNFEEIFYEVGRRPGFGGGMSGPDMAFEDGMELQARMFDSGETATREWLMEKFQKYHNLPNTHTSQPGNPDQGTLKLWKLWSNK